MSKDRTAAARMRRYRQRQRNGARNADGADQVAEVLANAGNTPAGTVTPLAT